MMNPILISSARRRMRSFRTCLIATVYGLALLGLVALSLWEYGQPTLSIADMSGGISTYSMLVIAQFVLIVLVAPAMTAGAISGERERQTLDLILVTGTGSFRIVLGKLLESFLFLALLIVTGLPFMAVVMLSGGITLSQLFQSVLFLLVSSFAALSVGIFCSSIFKRTAASTVFSYLCVFAIGVLTLIPLFLLRTTPQLRVFVNNIPLIQSVSRADVLGMFPAMLLVNPGIGLFALITAQGDMFYSAMRGYVPRGGMFLALLEKIGYADVAWINMGIMFALALVLIVIASLFVRPRRRIGRRRK